MLSSRGQRIVFNRAHDHAKLRHSGQQLTLLPLSIFPYDPVLRAYAAYRFFLLRLRMALLACLAGVS